jgi:hypothetical protein
MLLLVLFGPISASWTILGRHRIAELDHDAAESVGLPELTAGKYERYYLALSIGDRVLVQCVKGSCFLFLS